MEFKEESSIMWDSRYAAKAQKVVKLKADITMGDLKIRSWGSAECDRLHKVINDELKKIEEEQNEDKKSNSNAS